jgi:hypothetical protein
MAPPPIDGSGASIREHGDRDIQSCEVQSYQAD